MSSPTDLSAAVPEASTQERDCHTKTLQELSPNGFRVNSNNLRFWVRVNSNSNLRLELEFGLTPTPTSGSGLELTQTQPEVGVLVNSPQLWVEV